MIRFVLVVGILACQLAFAGGKEKAGSSTGNGGDTLAGEFVTTASRLIHRLEEMPRKDVRRIFPLWRFRSAVNRARVESTCDPISVEGIPKDATNKRIPKSILFNRSWWMKNKDDYRARLRTLIHEYMTVARLEKSDNYSRTIRLLTLLEEKGIQFEKLFPEVNENVECETVHPLAFLVQDWQCSKWNPKHGLHYQYLDALSLEFDENGENVVGKGKIDRIPSSDRRFSWLYSAELRFRFSNRRGRFVDLEIEEQVTDENSTGPIENGASRTQTVRVEIEEGNQVRIHFRFYELRGMSRDYCAFEERTCKAWSGDTCSEWGDSHCTNWASELAGWELSPSKAKIKCRPVEL